MREHYLWALTRISIGWIFLWAFLDKVFGLGFATEAGKSWLDGASPTYGFLSFATKGPMADIFKSLAGSSLVDWLFMLGLLGIGLSLMLGVALRLGYISGAIMMILMYLAGSIWPEHNPFMDEHIIYALVMLGLMVTQGNYEKRWSLSRWWANTGIPNKISILK